MSVPLEMAVVEIAAPGGPEQLKPSIRPVPRPGDEEVLVRVAAAGVNRPDVMQRQGRYPRSRPAPRISPVSKSRAKSSPWGRRPPDCHWERKSPLCWPGGGYAAYAVAAAPLCLPIPEGISMVEAAAIPETYFTVWTNLFDRGRCQAGETVLIHGGTSGIGTAAIQLAAAWGARVFATAGSDAKARACERLGAIRGINYRTEDFVEVMRTATEGKGVDLTLDMVAGSYVARNLDLAALEGRVVTISLLGGSRAEINMATILAKRLTLTGSTLRSRTIPQKAAVAAAVRKNIWPLLAAGRARPVIHATFPLAEASEAHRLMETSNHIGKIVLTVSGDAQ